jgi:hypothetical protein
LFVGLIVEDQATATSFDMCEFATAATTTYFANVAHTVSRDRTARLFSAAEQVALQQLGLPPVDRIGRLVRLDDVHVVGFIRRSVLGRSTINVGVQQMGRTGWHCFAEGDILRHLQNIDRSTALDLVGEVAIDEVYGNCLILWDMRLSRPELRRRANPAVLRLAVDLLEGIVRMHERIIHRSSLRLKAGTHHDITERIERLRGRESAFGVCLDCLSAFASGERVCIHGEVRAIGQPRLSHTLRLIGTCFDDAGRVTGTAQEKFFSSGFIGFEPFSITIFPASQNLHRVRLHLSL